MDFALKVLLAYLLGSVVGSLVVGRLRGGVDIRKLGSGNAGSTNALRTQGLAFGIWVIVIDVAKGWIAAALAAGARDSGHRRRRRRRWPAWLPAACGFAAIVGHVFPVWHGFRGGKGVATLVGAYAGPRARCCWRRWWRAGWRWSWCRASSDCRRSPPRSPSRSIYCMRDGARFTPLLGFALACAALVIYTHRGNVRRMRAGNEPRARKLWLFGRERP